MGEIFGPFNKKRLKINLLITGEIFGPFNPVTKRFDCICFSHENFDLQYSETFLQTFYTGFPDGPNGKPGHFNFFPKNQDVFDF
jgi:hypothetical protein